MVSLYHPVFSMLNTHAHFLDAQLFGTASVVSSHMHACKMQWVDPTTSHFARTGLRFMPDTEVDALVAEIEAEKAAAEAARRGQAAGS